jgi:CheY-like chemotaxis protein
VALRLATVYGIVKQHNGDITVSSDPGAGTAFEIAFPAAAAPPALLPAPEPRGRAGGILIVEDSNELRLMLRDLLADYGYAVFDAPGCLEARRLFEKNREAVILVIADVLLEDGSGRDLVREFRQRHASLRAIIITGYDPHQMRGKMDLQPNEYFLAKPFQTTELLQAIEALLRTPV